MSDSPIVCYGWALARDGGELLADYFCEGGSPAPKLYGSKPCNARRALGVMRVENAELVDAVICVRHVAVILGVIDLPVTPGMDDDLADGGCDAMCYTVVRRLPADGRRVLDVQFAQNVALFETAAAAAARRDEWVAKMARLDPELRAEIDGATAVRRALVTLVPGKVDGS